MVCKSVYMQKCEKLKEMRRDYALCHNEELKIKIYLISKEIKEIEKSVGCYYTSGNYKPKNLIQTIWHVIVGKPQ
jgi:hypothetical protein